MSTDTIDRIVEAGVSVVWRDDSLDFSPSSLLDEDLTSTIRDEAVRLHALGLEASERLDEVAQRRGRDPRRWQSTHKTLCERWPAESPSGYDLLVAWVGACLRTAVAQHRLDGNQADHTERASKRADLTWGQRLIPQLQRRLVSTSILTPWLHKQIMRMR